LTTKVHLVVDALGLPLAFRITEGNRHDILPAPELIEETQPRCLLGDKAYSSHAFRALLADKKCVAVIPSSSSWIDPPAYDRDLYKARAEVECTFNLLKQARRFATRYEKTLRNYAAVVALGCIFLWLRISL
jgi:transposase